MVLSACSPYFQALFVNHPEKHPIVILKDVPYADMKSLLDFMYRGEVSVDQDRLSAFLRVAESLRIKGLTEVNDDKPSNDSSESSTATPSRFTMQQQQQRKSQQQTTPQSGSHSMPKRKRGRPRKLSGSDDVDDYEDDYRENLLQVRNRGGLAQNGRVAQVLLTLLRSSFPLFVLLPLIGIAGTIGSENG